MKFLFLSIFLVACGDSVGTSPVPTPTAAPTATPTAVPIVAPTVTDLVPRRWSAPYKDGFINIDMEHMGDTVDMMYHFRSCLTADCAGETPMFFAVGKWHLGDAAICFDTVNYWEEPPNGFVISNHDAFCTPAQLLNGKLLMEVKGVPMEFTSVVLEWGK